MGVIKNQKFGSREFFIAYGMLLLGSFLFAVGDVLFVNPYKMAPGGVYGIANVLHHVLGWKISFTALLMDIPLLLLGTWILGPKFGAKTVISVVAIFFFVWLLEMTWGYTPVIHDGLLEGLSDKGLTFVPDYFLNTVVSGIIYGVAIGLIFKSGATSGGSDIIAMILNKYTKISLGNLVLIVDSLITLTTLIAFKDIRLPIYSIALIFVESKIIDLIIDGIKDHKTVLIISDKSDEIRHVIIEKVKRGGTFIKGIGMYEGADKNIIYTIVKRKEFIALKNEIARIDPCAFINVIESSEIMGRGFKRLHIE
jgi:uncharacterized membrane-anchored protein YitT (DUF2179 family)